MAHFQKAPDTVVTSAPAHITQEFRDRLAQSGTYSIFDENAYRLKVPQGNTTWKGQ